MKPLTRRIGFFDEMGIGLILVQQVGELVIMKLQKQHQFLLMDTSVMSYLKSFSNICYSLPRQEEVLPLTYQTTGMLMIVERIISRSLAAIGSLARMRGSRI
jgi:hypothetical protein